jgi:hypothetical protein
MESKRQIYCWFCCYNRQRGIATTSYKRNDRFTRKCSRLILSLLEECQVKTLHCIRGTGSINASSDPLIILDGAPFNGNLNQLALIKSNL